MAHRNIMIPAPDASPAGLDEVTLDLRDLLWAESSRSARLNTPFKELARQRAERINLNANLCKFQPATWTRHAQKFSQNIHPTLQRHRRRQDQALMDEIERIVTERQAFQQIAPHKFVVGRDRPVLLDIFEVQTHHTSLRKLLSHLLAPDPGTRRRIQNGRRLVQGN